MHHQIGAVASTQYAPLLLQIHASIRVPAHTKSLLEVREHLEVVMEKQEKLGVGPEAVKISCSRPLLIRSSS
jgi:hypothetical protein